MPSKRLSPYADLLTKAIKDKKFPARSKASLIWFNNQVKDLKITLNTSGIGQKQQPKINRYSLGELYYFQYDAKYKQTLPYWDRYPLVLPLSLTRNGFIGINFHYISPIHRTELFNNLLKLQVVGQYKRDKIRTTYEILNVAAKYKYFKPCVKRYSFTRIKKPFVRLDRIDWEIAMFLPMHNFMKQKKEIVWRESALKVKNRTTNRTKIKKNRKNKRRK